MQSPGFIHRGITGAWSATWRQSSRWQNLVAFLLIAVAASLLYLPYLANPLIFDDSNIFHTPALTMAATAPWEMGIRGLPYFTLGWVETQIGSMQAHRLLSLFLHIVVGYQLFRFIAELLAVAEHPRVITSRTTTHTQWIALLIAVAFVCHPAAVYGTGYLVQRTIVFATLFSLLCLRCFLVALTKDSIGNAISAAVWASLAILSKEHAFLVPVGALALIPVVDRRLSRTTLKTSAVFLALSLPAMVYGLATGLGTVGRPYEPGISELESELYALPVFSGTYEKWLLSATTQAHLYFGYWRQWLWPETARMSIDFRVDFRQPWKHYAAWLWIAGVAALPLVAMIVALRVRQLGVLAFGIAFTAVLFAIELVSIRFQEPYVLYRSYLWSIGYCTLAAGLIWRLPPRAGVLIMVLAIPLFFFQAKDRLHSFQTKLALWEDAGAKLPTLEIAGSSRILFNRGGERFRAGNVAGAMADITEAIRINPPIGRYRVAKAVALLRIGQPEQALSELATAKAMLPDNPELLFTEFRVLQSLGRKEKADAALLAAARLNHFGAKFELARRRSPNGVVTVNPNGEPEAN